MLDAQYFGVAQRRRRVFVVASARAGFDPLEVLFEREGVRRDTAPRRGEGQDLAGAYGTPILATADGTVSYAGWESGYGRLIKIKHAFGIETRYGHLSQIRVNVGDRVSRGERIGDMGNSGRSTGTHLHYEIRIGGDAINPMTFIKAARNVF